MTPDHNAQNSDLSKFVILQVKLPLSNTMSSTMEARYYPHKRAHSSIALPQEDDAREEECPSPPPFFRVSGMFTVFNPSRPMAEAKRKEQQALAVDIQSDDSDSTKQAMSMLDMPDLVRDNNNQHATCAAMQDDWSNSLEGMRDLSVDSSSNQHETQTAMDMLPMTPTAKTQASEALLKLSSLPVIPTPQGLALLLKTNHDTVSTNHRNGVSTTNTTTSLVDPPPLRRHARWTSEEDEVLRDAVAKEEGPPHNWKRISKKYFHGSRNAMACKGRWNKVNTLSALNLTSQFATYPSLTHTHLLNRIYNRVWYTPNGQHKKITSSCRVTTMDFRGPKLPTSSWVDHPNKFVIAFSTISILL